MPILDVALIQQELGRHCFRFTSEDELHGGIEAVLHQAGFPVEHEVRLACGRLDFRVGRIAIEVKINGGVSPLLRQLHRYATACDLDALLVITTRRRLLAGLPSHMNGKPIHGLLIGGI